MAVITISRQLGSLGCEIADEISNCLGYKIVYREIINQAAIQAGVPEVALATIDDLDLLGIRPSLESRNAYHHAVREIMHNLAHEGNIVIIGRAGQVVLRGMLHTIHVRLYAPLEIRIARISERHKISADAARSQVIASDQSRSRYLKRFYKTNWDDPNLYDIMINTARLSPKSVASVICESANRIG